MYFVRKIEISLRVIEEKGKEVVEEYILYHITLGLQASNPF